MDLNRLETKIALAIAAIVSSARESAKLNCLNGVYNKIFVTDIIEEFHMTDFLQLRVLTLNCWGIPLPFPFGSADRKVRIKEIAKELATGKYDIVSLQEIWSENDFNMIHDAVRLVMPYSFYFHNGYAGSGVCVFSKGIILETLMHRYSLNGYVHHIHRGDWFGGKMVGLCRIQFSGININVYATHIHAEYNHDEDVYLAHRVVQAFELGQFMRNTMQNCEMAILMGDLNLRPTDLGYDLIRHSASLKDAWLFFSLALYIWTVDVELHWPGITLPIIIFRFLLTLSIGFFFWYGLVCLSSEEKALKMTISSMHIQLERFSCYNFFTKRKKRQISAV
ncbi:putative neutral sphingomyelinase [Trichinella patagoniensis]|uniref:sphingomyelin phosphodiesterase n=1 Tax=Trichinella patagoniensis TaxID=990121 RepID=A0A0V1ACJ5_9BILA|nr:putative neutral sphingomyelinase [Trichinella patagoniensis]